MKAILLDADLFIAVAAAFYHSFLSRMIRNRLARATPFYPHNAPVRLFTVA
ncbi:hypothetical protein [Mixta gaviniae]|uniref:hypothetical protein n=1 Tax=Mixta gaviniae TaxID=665914 RepID=UPI00142DDED1|nr:hypothetical protein [Mixta gaviniae]